MDFSAFIKTEKTTFDAKNALNILFATSEVAPFSKTGGLGDVAQSLPKALAERGHHLTIVTPRYGDIDPDRYQFGKRLSPLEVKISARKKVDAHIWERQFGTGVTIYFVDYEPLFGREGVYGYDGEGFFDNAERYAFFSRAVVEIAKQKSVPFDVIHCNDWHTALVPLYVSREKELNDVTTVMTLHNAAYQGQFEKSAFDVTLLPKKTFLTKDYLAQGKKDINLLKGAIAAADRVTTVSPGYRDELLEKDTGFGLHTSLKSKKDAFTGILNGVDYSIWSPESDSNLPHTFTPEYLNGKRQNKITLQDEFGFDERPTNPMVAFVGRLTEQKGLDVLIPALRSLLKKRTEPKDQFQVVMLGEGDKKYASMISKLQKDFPKQVHAIVGYSEDFAHRFIAASDILVMPSAYEPCGLTQLYALRYGTLPVVHATGGLADTVTDADSGGNGFVYEKQTKAALGKALERALDRYSQHRAWRPMMVGAMEQDFSWGRSADAYEELYLDAVQEKRGA